MKYVRLIAKPDTWYKAGTEVWHWDLYDEKKLLSEEQWNECIKDSGIGCTGIRVTERDNEPFPECKVGEENLDEEWCSCDEFDIEIIEE